MLFFDELPSSDSQTISGLDPTFLLQVQNVNGLQATLLLIHRFHLHRRMAHYQSQVCLLLNRNGLAKIHDFCLGIPFDYMRQHFSPEPLYSRAYPNFQLGAFSGVLVLGSGLIGFILSGNARTLGTGVLYGGALLALSIISLKIWRKGKLSFPFILGQAAISATLLWKNLQLYTLTKRVVPTGLNIFISPAMLCFYSYVVISGGNAPPKKLKYGAVVLS